MAITIVPVEPNPSTSCNKKQTRYSYVPYWFCNQYAILLPLSISILIMKNKPYKMLPYSLKSTHSLKLKMTLIQRNLMLYQTITSCNPMGRVKVMTHTHFSYDFTSFHKTNQKIILCSKTWACFVISTLEVVFQSQTFVKVIQIKKALHEKWEKFWYSKCVRDPSVFKRYFNNFKRRALHEKWEKNLYSQCVRDPGVFKRYFNQLQRRISYNVHYNNNNYYY